MQLDEPLAIEFASQIIYFLQIFGLHRTREALINEMSKKNSDVGSQDWYFVQRCRGEQLFYCGYYTQAEVIFEEIFQKLKKTHDYDLYLTYNYFLLGRCLMMQGKTVDAIRYHVQGLGMAQQLEPSSTVQLQINSFHTELGTTYRENGNYDKAKVHYEQALASSKETGDIRNEAIIQSQLGNLAIAQGNFIEAEKHCKTALEMFESLSEARGEATVWHQLGYLYDEMKKWTLAEEAYRKSAEIREGQGDFVAAATTWNNLAVVFKNRGKLDVAEILLQKAIMAFKAANDLKSQSIGLLALADLLHNQPERLDEVRQLIEDSLEIKKILDEANTTIWINYNALAIIADKQEKNEQAKIYRQLSRDTYLYFDGMLSQIKQYAQLIGFVLIALENVEYRNNLKVELQNFPEIWQNLVKAIQAILNGERNEEILLEPLIYTEAAIIHLILKGIKNPESLETLFNA